MTHKSADKMIKKIISAASHIHAQLGPGRPETIYQTALVFELEKRHLLVQEHPQFSFQGSAGHFRSFRVSMMVEGRILVNLMLGQTIGRVDRKSMISYLYWAEKEIGVILNFGLLKNFRKEGAVWMSRRDIRGT